MNIRPKKHLGQHFLKDLDIAQKIAESLCTDCGNVLEIGPGTGVLTNFLEQRKDTVLQLMEVDHESVDYLKENYPGLIGHIHDADVLHYPLDELFPGQEFCIIGNFPYNISSQILFKMLEYKEHIPCLSGMFQKEVADRICAKHGNKTYGIISVLIQVYYTTEYLFTVPEHVFIPPPKVKSGVIRLKRYRKKIEGLDDKMLFRTVKTAFNQRRKTLRNALKPMVPDLSIIPEEMAGLRAEQLKPEDFIDLTKRLQSGFEKSNNNM